MAESKGTVEPNQPKGFAFAEAALADVRKIIARYPAGRQASAVIPVLHLVQRQEGWVSRPAMDAVAELLSMPPIKVYEVATFYTMFQLRPVGKHLLEPCTNLPCWLRGSDEVVRACKEVGGMGMGETSEDGLFTLKEAECLGACVNAPMMQIGDHYYEDLDYETTKALLDTLKRGETPKPGSQVGRHSSEPKGGPTTLVAAGEG